MGDSPVSVSNLRNSNNSSNNNSNTNNNNNRSRRNRNRNRNRTRNNNLSRFPLNVTNVLGPTARTRFLCDSSVSKEIFSGNPRLLHIKPFADKHGEGSFGYTISAEMKVSIQSPPPHEITCIAALKVSKRAERILETGVPSDLLKESSIYSRITNTTNLAKGMFIKLSMTETRIVMEHYVMNLTELIDALLDVGGMTEPLVRAIIFQVANGLAELHSLGILHKDLKLDNILVAHDGRLLITDYGLSVYHCVDPLKPREIYFKLTTPTIQPPETIDSDFVGPEFDIWSLGSTFSSLLVYPQYAFDFYAKNGWNPSNSRQNWMTAFRTTYATESHYERRIERIFSSRPAQSFSAASTNLLMRMLDLSPKRRPTAKQIINDPWFSGLTLDEAVRTVRLELGTLGTINKKTFSLLNSTKKPRNNIQNLKIDTYFSIKPNDLYITHVYLPRIKNISPFQRYQLISKIFFLLFQEKSYSFYIFLHAIELFERLSETYTVAHGPNQLFSDIAACFIIALKISPYEYDTERIPPLDFVKDIFGLPKTYNKSELIKSEIKIATVLHGDLFPVENGFVNMFLNTYMKRIQSDKKLYRFILGIVFYLFWDRSDSGYLVDFFHTVDALYVESGEVGLGIAGLQPNSKGKQFSISTNIVKLIHAKIIKFSGILKELDGISYAEKWIHLLNSLNPYIRQTLQLVEPIFASKLAIPARLQESSLKTVIATE
jgi:serine/threonine protein kinase